MARIILLIVLFWILYLIVKRIAAGSNTKPEQKSEQSPELTIVQCAHCGCHVPINETQTKNNRIICNNPECLKGESTTNKDTKN